MKNFFKYINLVLLLVFALNFIFEDGVYVNSEEQTRFSSMEFGTNGVSFNSANFYWRYPENVSFDMGDYLNLILIDKSIGKHGEIPVFSEAHNMNSVNLKSVTSFEANYLKPETSYLAQLEIVKGNGDSYVHETEFTTEKFEILNMSFQNADKGVTNKKSVRLVWDVSNSNVKFVNEDKIEIFIKKFSDNDFHKSPIFKSNEMVTRADIELPDFEELYDFKIVYTIGGKDIESEVFGIDVFAGGVNLKIEDVTTSSVKLRWEFEDEEILNGNSSMQIFMREDRKIEYDTVPFLEIKGKDELINKKEHLVENLKFNTKYKFKFRFTVEVTENFGESLPIFKEHEYECETKKVSLKDLKIESVSNNKCNLTWNYEGENISFSSKDILGIYIKESSDNQYSQPVLTFSESLIDTKSAEITLPKYNTAYDIKVNLSIGGKNLFEFMTYTIEPPKIIFGIQDITKESLKFIPKFDNISFEDGDKIQIFIKKDSDNSYPENPNKEIQQSSSEIIVNLKEINLDKEIFKTVQLSEVSDSKENENNSQNPQEKGQKYDFKVIVIKSGVLYQEEIYSVEMIENKLQIVKVSFENQTEKKVKATVEYAPHNFDFKDVESLSLYKSLSGVADSNQENLVNTIKENFKDNNTFIVEFDKFKNYNLRFVYKFKKDSQSAEGKVTRDANEIEVQDDPSNAVNKSDDENNDNTTTESGTPEVKADGKTSDLVDSSEDSQETASDSGSEGSGGSGTNDTEQSDSATSGDQTSSGSTSGSTGSSTPVNREDVVRDEVYNHKFDVMIFKIQDLVMSEIKLKIQFEKYYSVKDGDKIEIFLKKDGEDKFPDSPITTFEHGKDSVNLSDFDAVDITGLDHGTKYTFNVKFTPIDYKDKTIEKQIDVTTNDMEFSDISIRHVSDITAVIEWKLGDNFEFHPNDVLNIFYKKESETEYPKRPYETVNDIYLQDGVFVYLDNIDTKYDIKLVFQSGSKSFEKELELNTEVDVMNAEISEIYETSAYVKWNYPENYLITNGESISIFIKESNSSSYGDEPQYYMQYDEEKAEILQDFKSAKLFDLIPNTNYDVKVLLDFGEVGKRERELSFKTKGLEMGDISITGMKPFEFNISWDINLDTVDFDEESDFLNIYMKTSDQSWSEERLLYKVSKELNNFNKARFIVDDPQLTYDVKVEYDLAGQKISKIISIKLFTVTYKEASYGNIDVLLSYPSPLEFEEGDQVVLLLRKPKSSSYDQKFVSKHSVINDLNSILKVSLEDIEQTSHIACCIISKKVNIFPSQIIYDTRAENSSTLEIVSNLQGSSIDIELPTDYELDVTSEVRNSIGGNSYYEELDDNSYVIVIDGIVPGKTYPETMLLTNDVDGNEVALFLNEFTLEPSNLLEEFLRNSYFFAFDREPDEGGYTYWKNELVKQGDITGKYFLVNLMFAEKEFSDRNLDDEDLIKVLYQIVVNREYDSKGLSYWVGVYKQYLVKFDNDQYEAKKTVVLRMVYEPEFQQLCERMNVKW